MLIAEVTINRRRGMGTQAFHGPYIGDIVLLNSEGDSKKNKLGQELATGLEPNFTDVALCLGLAGARRAHLNKV